MPAPKNNSIEGKAQVSVIPLDLLIPLLEPAYREGIKKYHRESWRAGFQSTVMYDALMRHLTTWFFSLESNDPEAKQNHNIDKHHLGAAIFCLICLYDTEINHPEFDDRPLKTFQSYLDKQKAQRPVDDNNETKDAELSLRSVFG